MKGPGLRIDLDVRRIWCCAKCGKTVRTAVQVVAQRCGCADAPWMSLQPPVKREPFRPPVREPLPETEPVAESAVPAAVAAVAPIVEEPAVTSAVAEAVPVGGQDATRETPMTPGPSASVSPAPAASEPAPSATAAMEQSPHSATSDDFGAGLDDVVPGPPA